MKFKKIILAGGLLTSIASTGIVLSCSNSETKKDDVKKDDVKKKNNVSDEKYDFQGFGKLINEFPYQNVIFDAKILKWIDGDTAIFEYKDKTNGKWIRKNGGKDLSLRLASIDTPELHVTNGKTPTGDLGPKELLWAQKATDWAKKEIPEGSVIKIWKSGSDSYGRWVGSIFYGEKFKKNFSVNIIKEGFTIPRLDNGDDLFDAYVYSQKLLHYIIIPIWYAYHEAKNAKRNLFGLSQKELEIVYTKHGIPGNEINSIDSYKDDWMKDKSFVKYGIYKEK